MPYVILMNDGKISQVSFDVTIEESAEVSDKFRADGETEQLRLSHTGIINPEKIANIACQECLEEYDNGTLSIDVLFGKNRITHCDREKIKEARKQPVRASVSYECPKGHEVFYGNLRVDPSTLDAKFVTSDETGMVLKPTQSLVDELKAVCLERAEKGRGSYNKPDYLDTLDKAIRYSMELGDTIPSEFDKNLLEIYNQNVVDNYADRLGVELDYIIKHEDAFGCAMDPECYAPWDLDETSHEEYRDSVKEFIAMIPRIDVPKEHDEKFNHVVGLYISYLNEMNEEDVEEMKPIQNRINERNVEISVLEGMLKQN